MPQRRVPGCVQFAAALDRSGAEHGSHFLQAGVRETRPLVVYGGSGASTEQIKPAGWKSIRTVPFRS